MIIKTLAASKMVVAPRRNAARKGPKFFLATSAVLAKATLPQAYAKTPKGKPHQPRGGLSDGERGKGDEQDGNELYEGRG
jgi:hypothetical protein